MAARKKVQPKVEEKTEEVKVESTVKKYRCDFNSWEEYHNYKGVKG